jgi:hypothetical protein
MGVLEQELDSAVAAFDTSCATDVAAVNIQVAKKKLPAIVKLTPEAWNLRRSSM